ncbi:hypothetical protein ABW19_dt0207582 [Dactylella cylindrospora]|nr:hypothetical protein ABW19_dt0207582 [Dactylella cylindrospora]
MEPPPLPIFEQSELLHLLEHGQLDYISFIRPRQQYLRQNLDNRNKWPKRPIYQNLQTVMDYAQKTSENAEARRLYGIKELLDKIAKLDNHINSIYAAINDVFFTMHHQRVSLEKKLTGLRKNPSKNEGRMEDLRKIYESNFRSLRETLKAQREVLAIEEELRNSFLKELKTVCEKSSSTTAGGRHDNHHHGHNNWWKRNGSSSLAM